MKKDQFTSTKFMGAFVLNQDMVECLISKSMIVQRGQWIMFNGKNSQILDVVATGIWIKTKGQIRFVSVESAHPHYGINTNYEEVVSSLSLPLVGLAGGVALLLLTLIY